MLGCNRVGNNQLALDDHGGSTLEVVTNTTLLLETETKLYFTTEYKSSSTLEMGVSSVIKFLLKAKLIKPSIPNPPESKSGYVSIFDNNYF